VFAMHRGDTTPDTLTALFAEHDSVTVEKLDVTSVVSVDALAAKLEGRPIGVINLGAQSAQALGTLHYEQVDAGGLRSSAACLTKRE
jgi:hypothetical protein